MTLFIEADIHGGLAAAMANRLELGEIGGPAEQSGTAGKELVLKVGPECVAQHRDIEIAGDPCVSALR